MTTYQQIVRTAHQNGCSFDFAKGMFLAGAERHADHDVILDILALQDGEVYRHDGQCLYCGRYSLTHLVHDACCPGAFIGNASLDPRSTQVDTITSLVGEIEADRPGFTVDDLTDMVGR